MNEVNAKTNRYAVHYGEKYDDALTITEIAACVRRDIKAAIVAGVLPAIKTAVRVQKYSGGRSLTVTVQAAPMSVRNSAYAPTSMQAPNAPVNHRFNAAGEALIATLQLMVNAYNYDGSDSQTDYFSVNFYSHVAIGEGVA